MGAKKWWIVDIGRKESGEENSSDLITFVESGDFKILLSV